MQDGLIIEHFCAFSDSHQSVKGVRSGVSLANLYTASVMARN